MGFEWDDAGKAGSNFRKHGFGQLRSRTMSRTQENSGSSRSACTTGRLLVIVSTWRGENIRIISARAAEAHECAEYEGER